MRLSISSIFLLLSIPVPALCGQRGLAYSDPKLAQFFSPYKTVTWGYDWGYPSHGLYSLLEFVPMLWGNPTNNPSYQSEWASNVTADKATGSRHHLAFNEPDINNLSPADAAAAYHKFMDPYAAQGYKLGTPAVTNGGPPTGFTWLEQFLGNCTMCTIDFVPFHWYANWDQTDYFKQYIQQAYAVAGHRPIWITELQGLGTVDQQVTFVKDVVPWLDTQNYVQRYAYFGVFPGILINNASTGLSATGQAFATA